MTSRKQKITYLLSYVGKKGKVSRREIFAFGMIDLFMPRRDVVEIVNALVDRGKVDEDGEYLYISDSEINEKNNRIKKQKKKAEKEADMVLGSKPTKI